MCAMTATIGRSTVLSGRPKLDSTALDRALNGPGPRGLTIEDRVAMLDEVFRALLEDRRPSRAAALFVGGGGLSWLRERGKPASLATLYWKVVLPRSHRTTGRIWAELDVLKSEGEAEQDGRE